MVFKTHADTKLTPKGSKESLENKSSETPLALNLDRKTIEYDKEYKYNPSVYSGIFNQGVTFNDFDIN